MSKHLIALLFVGGLCMQVAHAQTVVEVGPHLGYDLNNVRPLVGGEARFHLPARPYSIQATFDYHFADYGNLDITPGSDIDFGVLQLGANVLFPLNIELDPLVPYVGAGAGMTRFSASISVSTREVRDSDSDSSMQPHATLLAGAIIPINDLKFFSQARLVLGRGYEYEPELFDTTLLPVTLGGSFFNVTFGLLFSL